MRFDGHRPTEAAPKKQPKKTTTTNMRVESGTRTTTATTTSDSRNSSRSRWNHSDVVQGRRRPPRAPSPRVRRALVQRVIQVVVTATVLIWVVLIAATTMICFGLRPSPASFASALSSLSPHGMAGVEAWGRPTLTTRQSQWWHRELSIRTTLLSSTCSSSSSSSNNSNSRRQQFPGQQQHAEEDGSGGDRRTPEEIRQTDTTTTATTAGSPLHPVIGTAVVETSITSSSMFAVTALMMMIGGGLPQLAAAAVTTPPSIRAIATAPPAAAAAAVTTPPSLLLLASSSSLSSSSDWEQTLRHSLTAPTDERPQIPFPTSSASSTSRQTENDPNKNENRNNKTKNKPVETATAKTTTVPTATNVPFRSQQYTVPVQIDTELSAGSVRPYTPTDSVVLQVWTARPDANAERSGTPAQNVLLGGAKVPVGVIGMTGFPIRLSVGPQNAVAVVTASSRSSSSSPNTEEVWQRSVSSKDVWIRAAICRDSTSRSVSSVSSNDNKDTVARTGACPVPEFRATPLMEGIGISKFITFPTTKPEEDERSATNSSGSSRGVRVPATIVLSLPSSSTPSSSTPGL